MTYKEIMEQLTAHGFQAYIVGGAVRDQILGIEPKDYDLATDALPEELLELFPGAKAVSATFHDVVYVGDIEVATMREDGPYSDNRRPDYTVPTKDIYKDLARRDFTCNAMALELAGDEIIDPFKGANDLMRGFLRAVGDPTTRIIEHPVRLLRAVRFAAKYGLWIEPYTAGAMYNESGRIRLVPLETVLVELRLGLDLDNVGSYLELLCEYGFLQELLPEVAELAGLEQNVYHNGNTAYVHTVLAVERAPKGLARLVALLHDIGKARTQEFVDDEYGYSFIGHEHVGADMADEVCRRLRLTNEERHLVVMAVRMHMAHIKGPKSARRFLACCGDVETARFVLEVMDADRAGRYPLDPMARKLVEAEVEAKNAIRVTDLAVNGRDVMEVLGLEPGPEVGDMLDDLLEMVINDPSLNKRVVLMYHLENNS